MSKGWATGPSTGRPPAITIHSVASPKEAGSLRGLISTLLQRVTDIETNLMQKVTGIKTNLMQKVTGIEIKLQELTPIRLQLTTLERGVQQCTAAVSELTGRTDALTTTTRELRREQERLDERVRALERPALQTAGDGLEQRLEARLEALSARSTTPSLSYSGSRRILPRT